MIEPFFGRCCCLVFCCAFYSTLAQGEVNERYLRHLYDLHRRLRAVSGRKRSHHHHQHPLDADDGTHRVDDSDDDDVNGDNDGENDNGGGQSLQVTEEASELMEALRIKVGQDLFLSSPKCSCFPCFIFHTPLWLFASIPIQLPQLSIIHDFDSNPHPLSTGGIQIAHVFLAARAGAEQSANQHPNQAERIIEVSFCFSVSVEARGARGVRVQTELCQHSQSGI